MKRTLIIGSLLTSLVLAACGTTGNGGGERMGQGHRGHGESDGMRQAAIAACEGKIEGARVTLMSPNGESIAAVCGQPPMNKGDGKLVAMPERMLQQMQAAKAACVGKQEGDTVQLSDMRDSGKTMSATCVKHGDQLLAHPMRKEGWDKGGRREGASSAQ